MLDGLPADGVTRIVVGHGAVDIFVPDKDRPSLIRLAALEAAITRDAVHYVALGDKHSRMEVGSTGRVWYSGSPEVTNYDDIETDPGHVLVVDIDEDDPKRPVRVDARRVGRWRFVTLRRSVDSSRDVADLDINLDLMPDKERTVVRLSLTGSLTVTDKATSTPAEQVRRLFASLVMGRIRRLALGMTRTEAYTRHAQLLLTAAANRAHGASRRDGPRCDSCTPPTGNSA